MNKAEEKVINFNKLAGKVYIGRPDGALARKYFKLDEVDREHSYPVKVIFPADAKTITSSFFLGMFGKSVLSAGTKEQFMKNFVFDANPRILNEVEIGIFEALSSRC
ncbi:hypothetical protein [Shewanella algae]|uniref:hypothetical protein n=1 Tax=Shewanella algae TaxID=38313 RepID=UPI0031F5DA65